MLLNFWTTVTHSSLTWSLDGDQNYHHAHFHSLLVIHTLILFYLIFQKMIASKLSTLDQDILIQCNLISNSIMFGSTELATVLTLELFVRLLIE